MKFKNKLGLKFLFLILLVIQSLKAEETDPGTTENAEPVEGETQDQEGGAEGENLGEGGTAVKKGKECKQGIVELLQIPDVVGLATSSSEPLDICPHIKHSCCDAVDGDKFKKNFTEIVQPRLTEVLGGQQKIYESVLGSLEETSLKAQKILKMGATLDNNCILMARRIFNYDLVNQNAAIKSMIAEYHETLTDIYRSVYCSVCDALAHPFLETGAVTINYETCREFSYSALGFLLYFHVDIVPLLNLSLAFESTCTDAGVYDEKKMPKNDLFRLNNGVATTLNDAKENRNAPNWFEFFGKICTEMKWGQVTPFFMPNVKEFEAYVEVVKHLRNPVVDQGGPQATEGGAQPTEGGNQTTGETPGNNQQAGTGTQTQPPGRILTDNQPPAESTTENNAESGGSGGGEEEKKEEDIAEILKPIEPLKVFHKDNSKSAPIDAVAFAIADKGLELFEIARSTVIGGDRKLRLGHKRHKRVKRGRRGRGLNSRKRSRRRRLNGISRMLITAAMALFSLLMI